MKRDVAFPTDWAETHKLSTRTGTDYFLDMLEMWDGTNTAEVYAKSAESGFLHSPIPDPQNFVLGVLSQEESDAVATALTPAGERIVKGHLVDPARAKQFRCNGHNSRARIGCPPLRYATLSSIGHQRHVHRCSRFSTNW